MRVGSNPTGDTIYPFNLTDRISDYESEDECSIHSVGANRKGSNMKILIAQHKQDKNEVLLASHVIAESLIKFLNKNENEDSILVSKEDFIKYLDELSSQMPYLIWLKNKKEITTQAQAEVYQKLSSWAVNIMHYEKIPLDEIEDLYYNKDYYIYHYFDNEDYEIYIS